MSSANAYISESIKSHETKPFSLSYNLIHRHMVMQKKPSWCTANNECAQTTFAILVHYSSISPLDKFYTVKGIETIKPIKLVSL